MDEDTLNEYLMDGVINEFGHPSKKSREILKNLFTKISPKIGETYYIQNHFGCKVVGIDHLCNEKYEEIDTTIVVELV